MKKHGFTLIELLVAIVIISILMLLILPAIGTVREKGRTIQCASNMRQVGMAIKMYMEDHEFHLPPFRTGGAGAGGIYWPRFLEPYVDDIDVFRCPSYKNDKYGSKVCSSFGYNRYGLGDGEQIHISSIANPTQLIMVADGGRRDDRGHFEDEKYSMAWVQKSKTVKPPWPRHSGGFNILFVDGHVKWHHADSVPMDGDASADVLFLWWGY